MQYSIFGLTTALLSIGMLATVQADHYAVLIAGSNTYSNYRHQADVCHANKVHLMKETSAPEHDVIAGADYPQPGAVRVRHIGRAKEDFPDVTSSRHVRKCLFEIGERKHCRW